MQQRILLTGATGLTGSDLLEELIRQGHQVTALSRRPREQKTGVTWKLQDLSLFDPVFFNALGSFDVLIHNAATVKTGTTDAEKSEINRVNTEFTRALFNWSAHTGIDKILFTSSLSFLKHPLPEVIDEEAPVHSVHAYGESKLKGENMLTEIASSAGIPYFIFRLSSPVPLRPEPLPDTVLRKWINLGRAGSPITVFGTGNRTQNFVSTTDLASLYATCIGGEYHSGVYHLASVSSISMYDLAWIIAAHFRVPVELRGIDKQETERWNISSGKVRKEFGWKPRYDSETVIRELLKNTR